MTLVSALLNGENYISWNRSVKIALGAKNKLNFVDGTPSPEMDYTTWKKADCMVMSWLLNSISKDIAESFVYSNSSKDLWEEI